MHLGDPESPTGLERLEGAPQGLEARTSDAPYLDGATFRRRWAEAERRVCCIDVETSGGLGGGTGFLVGPDLVLTSGHVVQPPGTQGPIAAERIVVRFDYHRRDPRRRTHGLAGSGDLGESALLLVSDYLVASRPPSRHDAGDQGGLPAEEELDYAILRLAEPIGEDGRGWYRLEDQSVPRQGTFLTVVQHPSLGPRSNAFETQGVIGPNANGTRLRHRVNTEGGSSGSPCFDGNFSLVGVHQAGDPRAPLQGKAQFNQAIPIGRIRRDLEAQNLWPLPSASSGELEPPEAARSVDAEGTGSTAVPGSRSSQRSVNDGWQMAGLIAEGALPNPLDPTLILLALPDEASQERCRHLIAEARVPPEFVVRLGNNPPATIGDNAVAVYFGQDGAPEHEELTTAAEALRQRRLEIIPVVEDLEAFHQQVPEVLFPCNGMVWNEGAPPPELCARIRQLLGLEVDPAKRSIFVSYSRRDSGHEVGVLKEGLEARGFDVFVDVDDVQPGQESRQVIEAQFTSRHALLYLESANTWQSSWIRDQLLWAHTRGLAIVILQRGEVEHRHHLAGNLPRLFSDPRIPIGDEVDRLTADLDRRIARASTRMVQLRSMVEAILESHPRANRVSLESLTGESALATCEVQVLGRPNRRRLFFQWSPHRPSPPLVQHLVAQLDELALDGAVLLYEAPERPLEETEVAILDGLVGQRKIWWIERQGMKSDLGELLDHLTA